MKIQKPSKMQLTGSIKLINDTEVISDKFQKRSFVIVTDEEKYPQEIMIETTQDNVSLLDKFAEGETVTASINIRGRAWESPKDGTTKYFNTIQAWRIEGNTNAAPAPASAPATESNLPF